MKKKALAISLAAMMSVSGLLAGCGSEPDEAQNSNQVNQSGETGDNGANSGNLTGTVNGNSGENSENSNNQTTGETDKTEDGANSGQSDGTSNSDDSTNSVSEAPVPKAAAAGFVQMQICEDYNDVMDDAEENYYASCRTEGLIPVDPAYEKLRDGLAKHTKERQKLREEYSKQVMEQIQFVDDEAPSDYWFFYDEVDLTRTDEKVVSFWRAVSSYAGGAHENCYYQGFTFSTETGKQLLLQDVVKDYDKLYQLVLASLQSNPEKEYFVWGWEDIVKECFETPESSVYSYSWTLSPTGITVCFDEYNLTGYGFAPIMIDISYEDYPEIFVNQYALQGGKVCRALALYTDYYLDLNQDGNNEYLYIDSEGKYNEEYGYFEERWGNIKYGKEASSAEVVKSGNYESVDGAWLMEAPNGKYFLYLVVSECNDTRMIEGFDLSDPEAGAKPLGIDYMSSLDSQNPTTPDSVMMYNSLYYLGTYVGTRACKLENDGSFSPMTEYYLLGYSNANAIYDGKAPLYDFSNEFRNLTLLQDVEFEVFEDMESWKSWNGKQEKIPAGTKLQAVACDGENYILLMMEDGRLVQVSYDVNADSESFERTIQGYDEFDLFDGIIYAG